jgi:hypothetical protein
VQIKVWRGDCWAGLLATGPKVRKKNNITVRKIHLAGKFFMGASLLRFLHKKLYHLSRKYPK